MMRGLKVTAMHSTQKSRGNGRYELVPREMNRFTSGFGSSLHAWKLRATADADHGQDDKGPFARLPG